MVVLNGFLKQLKTNKGMVLMYLAIQLFIGVMWINASPAGPASYEKETVSVGVIDRANNSLSHTLIDAVAGDRALHYDDEDTLREALYTGEISGGIEIPADVEERLNGTGPVVETYRDERHADGYFIQFEVQRALMYADAQRKTAGQVDSEKLIDVLNTGVPVEFVSAEAAAEDAAKQRVSSYISLTAYTLLSMMILLIGSGMADLNRREVATRIGVSSMPATRYHGQIFLGQGILSLALIAALFIPIYVIAPEGVAVSNMPAYLISVGSLAACGIGINFLINSLTNNHTIVSAFSTAVPLGLSFISGIFIDAEWIAKPAYELSKLFPVYYFVQNNRTIAETGHNHLPYPGIILLFALFYIALGAVIRKLKRR